MKISGSLPLLVAALGANAFAADDGWIALFNGKDLTGWVQHSGKAKYAVEDGLLVGTAVPGTGNSFLCTKDTYGDFALELEFRVDSALNSGVQIRSECFEDPRTLQIGGKSIKVAADRVHGYQVEIDMDSARKRWWTGGIYDEARRGWLYPGPLGGDAKAFTAQGGKVSKPGEWNQLRVEAVGPSIKTWLNGELRADIKDSLTPQGFIALQVHGVGRDQAKAGLKVCFRNLRLKRLSAGTTAADSAAPNTLSAEEQAAGWRLLWDGQTTEGWRSVRSDAFPQKGWAIKDGALCVLGSSVGEPSGGDIITREKYSNFELQADFKITPGANSGIKYFIDPEVNKGGAASIGFEYQILDDQRHPDAKLGRNGDRTEASLYDLLPAAPTKPVKPIGEWNTARIVVQGKHVEHWLNGEKVLAFDLGSPAFREAVALSKFKNVKTFGTLPGGHILLQDHGNPVCFRNLKIRPLAAPPSAMRVITY